MKDFIGTVILKFVMVSSFILLMFVYLLDILVVFEEIVYYVCKFLCESYFERKNSRK